MTQEHHHTSRGKWSNPRVPHKGWTCVDVDDLGAPDEVCQMCEGSDIRYVHYMSHPNYPETLAVGCVRAEHMEEDYTRPKGREKDLRSLATGRKTWFDRKWRENAKGNLVLKTEGFLITLFRRESDKWAVSIHKPTLEPVYSKRSFEDLHSAKDAALRALIWAKHNL